MASAVCAFCGVKTHMTAKWAEGFYRPSTSGGNRADEYHLQGIARCDNCGRTSMGVTDSPASHGSNAVEKFGHSTDDSFEWYPRKGMAPDFPDVPAHIATAAIEAHATASINALMAAILMARTVVEATAKEKGILTGRLWEKIDALQTAGHIRQDTREAAHEIRHFGNDMAHGDIADQPDAEDADEVLALMDELLAEVFQGPARTARIKAKRTAP